MGLIKTVGETVQKAVGFVEPPVQKTIAYSIPILGLLFAQVENKELTSQLKELNGRELNGREAFKRAELLEKLHTNSQASLIASVVQLVASIILTCFVSEIFILFVMVSTATLLVSHEIHKIDHKVLMEGNCPVARPDALIDM